MQIPEIKIARTPGEKRKAFAIRRKVFIDEQCVPVERERDGDDRISTHVIILAEGKIVGTARFHYADKEKLKIKVERMAMLADYRKKGFGEQIIQFIEDYARKRGVKELLLHSQVHAKRFYEKCGFTAHGEIFMDAGIEHCQMTKKIWQTI